MQVRIWIWWTAIFDTSSVYFRSFCLFRLLCDLFPRCWINFLASIYSFYFFGNCDGKISSGLSRRNLLFSMAFSTNIDLIYCAFSFNCRTHLPQWNSTFWLKGKFTKSLLFHEKINSMKQKKRVLLTNGRKILSSDFFVLFTF